MYPEELKTDEIKSNTCTQIFKAKVETTQVSINI